ncbi:MAG: 2-oxoacid:ferredoxin oxidoreductase subunit beta [Firmicutes bacterium]|nr:2-oxoacid:ferredoxin oxidoreductase subunit beta [Bacillota bacterium]
MVKGTEFTLADYKAERPTWCAGCGDFGVLAAIQKAATNLHLHPDETAVISGIGCSGKMSSYVNVYGLHGIHGRTLPIATGVKLANRKLTVIASGGDGDGYAIGVAHFVHACRRNLDITYVVMDNNIYGLTTGQTSPTSRKGFRSKTSPEGSLEEPVRPLELALTSGASFVAQGFSGDVNTLADLIARGIRHKGFALINAISPCVTFNKVYGYDYFKQNLKPLGLDGIDGIIGNESPVGEAPNVKAPPSDDASALRAEGSEGRPTGHNIHDRLEALGVVMEHDGLVTGLIYEDTERPSFDDGLLGYDPEPLAHQNLDLNSAQWEQFTAQFY